MLSTSQTHAFPDVKVQYFKDDDPKPKEHYAPPLSKLQLQKACNVIDEVFSKKLEETFNLTKVQAPLCIRSGFTGLNDDLDGKRQPVRFYVKNGNDAHGMNCEVLQASTKWKRWALKQFEVEENEGLWVDLRAIRKDTTHLDQIHSVFVDQWDWELRIAPEKRTLDFLKEVVMKIWRCIKETEAHLEKKFPQLRPTEDGYSNQRKRFVPPRLPEKVTFLHSAELLDMYPDKKEPNDRENAFFKDHPDEVLFIYGIGMKLKNGQRHQERAPDYDLWKYLGREKEGLPGLNGDLLVYNHITGERHELSSMGIRIGPNELIGQLKDMGFESRLEQQKYHQMLYYGDLPHCIGGGIGKSRLFALMLHCFSTGEVVSSPWPDKMIEEMTEMGVELLQ